MGRQTFGDSEGHPFHGNQYTGGSGDTRDRVSPVTTADGETLHPISDGWAASHLSALRDAGFRANRMEGEVIDITLPGRDWPRVSAMPNAPQADYNKNADDTSQGFSLVGWSSARDLEAEDPSATAGDDIVTGDSDQTPPGDPASLVQQVKDFGFLRA